MIQHSSKEPAGTLARGRSPSDWTDGPPARWPMLLVTILPWLAAICLLVDPRMARNDRELETRFQRSLGGLGTSNSTTLSAGADVFDARLDAAGAADSGPVPAGGWFSTETLGLLPTRPSVYRESLDAEVH